MADKKCQRCGGEGASYVITIEAVPALLCIKCRQELALICLNWLNRSEPPVAGASALPLESAVNTVNALRGLGAETADLAHIVDSVIDHRLAQYEGNVTSAAESLNISRKTIYNRMSARGLKLRGEEHNVSVSDQADRSHEASPAEPGETVLDQSVAGPERVGLGV